MMPAVIGEKAPNLRLSEWVQGIPTNFDQEKDHIVIVEVFQVNCPGCFLYGIPEAISVYEKYSSEGVRVIGVATAFEDYDKNTLGNLKMLAETGEVVGDTKRGSKIGSKDALNDALQDPDKPVVDSAVVALSNIEFMDTLGTNEKFAKLTGG